MTNPFFEFSPAITQAIKNQQPVLALESTVLSHGGFEYPLNYELGKSFEKIALEYHVTPATIAIMNGKIKIGLTDDDLQVLTQTKSVRKASTLDLSYVLSKKQIASTTVAATMFCAHYAGIKIFATGGIGGVHRGYQQSLDASADLTQLANTPVAVVSSGAKNILDVGKTLEYLETLGVPVLGYQTNSFPLFYTVNSCYPIDKSVDSIETAADYLTAHWALGVRSGAVIANPIPKQDALDEAEFETWLMQAIADAKNENIHGKAITPFLLQKLFHYSQGQTRHANIALLKNNVKVGAQIASRLAG